MLQQQGADAETTGVVGDQERDLGMRVGDGFGRRETDEPAMVLGHQGQRRRAGEHVVDVAVRGVACGSEEPQPQRLVGDALVQLVKSVGVAGPERTHDRHRAVRQEHVGRREPHLDGHAGCDVERHSGCGRARPVLRDVIMLRR